ncbi:MAG TPA: dipeptide epimerase [Candidatus Baltobacteraceae bacterium]|jgi:L-alanine-DL-glutamate epimerase-like enolase superfamily enzyme|nr:dipeptide epimerase [Candidatus Baltobacteraceae bacterium]
MSGLSLSLSRLDLTLVHPFTIARGSEDVAHTAVFRLRWNGIEGLGESVPIERYGESVDSVLAYFRAQPPAGEDPYCLDELLGPQIPPAARCGLDIALHDLIGKDCGLPLYRLFGLDPRKTPITSFTIGIGEPDVTRQKLREIGGHPIVKVKLGSGSVRRDVETIELIRSTYTGTIRVDANEGWNVDEAVTALRELERFDIEFCEQPVPAGHPERLRYVRDRSKIPIVTDEDSLTAADLPKLAGCVDGVNVKLAKTGGIRGAIAMIHTARALGMKIMLGCMVESQISATAAAHISPLVDWADIDGPLLTKDDPFTGISYDRGKIVLPDAPGLGVMERAAVA